MRTIFIVQYHRWDESFVDSSWPTEPEARQRIKDTAGSFPHRYYSIEERVVR